MNKRFYDIKDTFHLQWNSTRIVDHYLSIIVLAKEKDTAKRILENISEYIGGYSVEETDHILYINMGDTYDTTIVVPYKKGTYIPSVESWGGWIERHHL